VAVSSSRQPTSVKKILWVSSSSSLTRQQRPQPSQRLSHSALLISSRRLARQNGTSTIVRRRTRRLLPRCSHFPQDSGNGTSSQFRRNAQADCQVLVSGFVCAHWLRSSDWDRKQTKAGPHMFGVSGRRGREGSKHCPIYCRTTGDRDSGGSCSTSIRGWTRRFSIPEPGCGNITSGSPPSWTASTFPAGDDYRSNCSPRRPRSGPAV